jgi:transposase InsO family protein
VSDQFIQRRVEELAIERGEAILGRSQLFALIKERRDRIGRKPSSIRTSKLNASRASRQLRKQIMPAQVLAIDFTPGSLLVCLWPGAKQFRCKVSFAVDVTSGAVLGCHLTGHERAIEVSMLLYDAVRSFRILPGGGGGRLQPLPSRIECGADVWAELNPQDAPVGELKRGGVPDAIRCDNAAVFRSMLVMSVLNRLGVDFRPSRVGRSTDNPHVESAFSAMRKFVEECPNYVGSNSTERGSKVGSEEAMTPQEFQQYLNKKILLERNNEIVDYRFGTGERVRLSRVDYWDLLVSQYGEVPILVDTDSLFTFLPTAGPTLTNKGLLIMGNTFDSGEIHASRAQLVKRTNGRVQVWYDPRNWDHVWVRHQERGRYIAVPNVLREMTEQPLVDSFLLAARKLMGLRAATPMSETAHLRRWAKAVDTVARRAREDNAIDIATSRDLLDYDRSVQVQSQNTAEMLNFPNVPQLKRNREFNFDPIPPLSGDGQ